MGQQSISPRTLFPQPHDELDQESGNEAEQDQAIGGYDARQKPPIFAYNYVSKPQSGERDN